MRGGKLSTAAKSPGVACPSKLANHTSCHGLVLYYSNPGKWPGLVRMGRFNFDLAALRALPDGLSVRMAATEHSQRCDKVERLPVLNLQVLDQTGYFRDYHAVARPGRPVRAASFVTSVNDSSIACAASIRSKGSRCSQSSRPANNACSSVMGRRAAPRRLRCREYPPTNASA